MEAGHSRKGAGWEPFPQGCPTLRRSSSRLPAQCYSGRRASRPRTLFHLNTASCPKPGLTVTANHSVITRPLPKEFPTLGTAAGGEGRAEFTELLRQGPAHLPSLMPPRPPSLPRPLSSHLNFPSPQTLEATVSCFRRQERQIQTHVRAEYKLSTSYSNVCLTFRLHKNSFMH